MKSFLISEVVLRQLSKLKNIIEILQSGVQVVSVESKMLADVEKVSDYFVVCQFAESCPEPNENMFKIFEELGEVVVQLVKLFSDEFEKVKIRFNIHKINVHGSS